MHSFINVQIIIVVATYCSITRIMLEHWWRSEHEEKKKGGEKEKEEKRRSKKRCFTGNRTQDLSHGKSKL